MDRGEDREGGAKRALELAEELLRLLDAVPGIPGEVGAHLDLAIHRLRGHISLPTKSPWPETGNDFV